MKQPLAGGFTGEAVLDATYSCMPLHPFYCQLNLLYTAKTIYYRAWASDPTNTLHILNTCPQIIIQGYHEFI